MWHLQQAGEVFVGGDRKECCKVSALFDISLKKSGVISEMEWIEKEKYHNNELPCDSA